MRFCILICSFILACWCTSAQQNKSTVHIVGAMKEVMWKNQLSGKIDLDTLSDTSALVGLGPVEYLQGELTIIDGKSYRSSVDTNGVMVVQETYQVKAPFFGYANLSKTKAITIPAWVHTLYDVELFIDSLSRDMQRPFMFKIAGSVDTAHFHIMNLPSNTVVQSPEDAHRTQVNYIMINENVDIVGFFSTEHQTILTHHDTFLHLHIITENRRQMGHVDQLQLKPGTATLYIPIE